MDTISVLRLISEYENLINVLLMKKTTGLYKSSDLITIKHYQEEIRKLNSMLIGTKNREIIRK